MLKINNLIVNFHIIESLPNKNTSNRLYNDDYFYHLFKIFFNMSNIT